MKAIILSHYQARDLLNTRSKNLEISQVSLDLGLSKLQARIMTTGVSFDDGQYVTWDFVSTIAESPSSCFIIENGVA